MHPLTRKESNFIRAVADIVLCGIRDGSFETHPHPAGSAALTPGQSRIFPGRRGSRLAFSRLPVAMPFMTF